MELDLIENREKSLPVNTGKTLKIKKNKFHISAKSFFLTYPKCDLEKAAAQALLLDKLLDAVQYLCVAQEYHEDGDRHLHVLLILKEKKNVYNEKYFDLNEYHGNYQSTKSTDNVRTYITKTDVHPLEMGEYLSNKQSAVQKRAMDNKVMLNKSMKELIDEGVISLHNYALIKNAKEGYKLDSKVVPEYMPKTCIWLYGPTGIGKSRYVRDNYKGQFFNKPMNKWWDGYTGETCVLIDDFDLKGEVLGHYLKIWGDCYSFNSEVKGGTIKPVFDTLIITSQYTPTDIWVRNPDMAKNDIELVKAIERRFSVKTIEDGIIVDCKDYVQY